MSRDPSVILPANGHVQVGPSSASVAAQAARLEALRVAVSLPGSGPYSGDDLGTDGTPKMSAVAGRFNTLQGLMDISSPLNVDTATVAQLAAGIDALAAIGLVAA